MKKLLPCLALLVLSVLALGGTAGAKPPTLASLATTVTGTTSTTAAAAVAVADRVNPTVTAITPSFAPNDIDAAVTISGTGFTAVMSGTVVLTPPNVTLGGTALTNVVFLDSTTLTATVPWGMNPGVYPLTVVNPDGGTSALPGAYTVTPGIGQWNGGNLFGGDVHQLLMKPGDSNTLYAPAYGLSGLFRSTDAGESWQYTGSDLNLGNYRLAVDPQHPDWLWAYENRGVVCSKDQGSTWAVALSNWPDGRQIGHGQVYPSPSDPNVLFVGSYLEPYEPDSVGAQGLIRSADGGVHWQIVPSLAGASVEDVVFDPNDAAQMVLVTRDAQVYHSGDAGLTWTKAAAALPGLTSIGFNEKLAYNPYVSGEVWIVSDEPDAVFKSISPARDDWLRMLPSDAAYVGGVGIAFSGDSVYRTWFKTANGGTKWEQFGPATGIGALLFDPTDSRVGYVGDRTYGVQKTTDGGTTWAPAKNGLAGVTCNSLDVSPSDPRRVFAVFGTSANVYCSQDGAGTWGYTEVGGLYGIMSVVRIDPTDPNRVYAAGNDHVYVSTSKGSAWDDIGWHATPVPPAGGLWTIEPDPFQPGHLLASWWSGDWVTGAGYLYASSDYGASWQAVSMPQTLVGIRDIAFDPQTPGLVYIAAGGGGSETYGTGVLKSTDHGATWTRIDDLRQPGMRGGETIAIATHPQHVVLETTNGKAYRSTDGGATWRRTQDWMGNNYVFVNNDSTRLYAGSVDGLYLSSDLGDTWTRAAGAFGHLQITALGYVVSNGQAIIYAATNGGQAAAGGGTATRVSGTARATASRHVDAGIYRYVVVTPKLSLKLSGLKKGVLKFGKRLTAKGVVKPVALAGSKVKFVLQKKAGKWRAVKSVMVTIKRGGVCSWTYKPAKRGTYRLQVSIAKAATRTAATTKWLGFKVK